MKIGIIIATAILLVVLPTCKGKSNEEKIEELEKKLENAKTAKEVEIYAEEIERLQQAAKENAKKVTIKLGQPFSFWNSVDIFSNDLTQYSMTFLKAAITDEDILGGKIGNKKCVMVLAKIHNLGPRKAENPPSGKDIQFKTDKGYLYRADGYPATDFFSTEPPFPLDWSKLTNWRHENKEALEPGENGWVIYYAWIPEDNKPIEIIAQFFVEAGSSGGGKLTSFNLKMTQTEESATKKEIQINKSPKQQEKGETQSIFQRLFGPWWSTNKNENKENITPNTQVPKENTQKKSKLAESNPVQKENTESQKPIAKEVQPQNSGVSSKPVTSVESISSVQMPSRQKRRQPVEYQKIEASGNNANANIIKTQENLNVLHNAVTQFKIDTGRYPAEDLGLLELVKQPTDVTGWKQGGYLTTKEIPKDAWGNDFIYQVYPESGKPFVIISYGADAKKGGDGDNADLSSK